MSKHTHLEWLNRNSLRSYPIREDQGIIASDGFEMPYDLLVDVKISTPYEMESVGVLSVFITTKIISINFCDQDSVPIATSVFPIGDEFVYGSVGLSPLVDGVAGSAVCGPCAYTDRSSQLMAGHHVFSTPCWLEKTTCMGLWEFPIKSISAGGFSKLNGSASLTFSGDIRSTLSKGLDASNRPSTFVMLELQNQENYLSKCESVQSVFECGKTPIMSINGVSPDSSGRIFLNFVGFDDVMSSGGTILVSKTATADELCDQSTRPVIPDECGYLPGQQPSATPQTATWSVDFDNLGESQSVGTGSSSIMATYYSINPFNYPAILKITGSVDDDLIINGFRYESGFFPYVNAKCTTGNCTQVSSWSPTSLEYNGTHSLSDPYVLEVNAAESTKIELYNNWGTTSGTSLLISYAPVIPCGSRIKEPVPDGYRQVVKRFSVDVDRLSAGNSPSNFTYGFPNTQLLGLSYPLTPIQYDLPSGATARVWQRRTYQNPFKSSSATVRVSGYADGGVGINGNILAYMRGETYQSSSVDPSQYYQFGITNGDSFDVDWIAYNGQQGVNKIDITVTISRL
jgi:hypothetical protein